MCSLGLLYQIQAQIKNKLSRDEKKGLKKVCLWFKTYLDSFLLIFGLSSVLSSQLCT